MKAEIIVLMAQSITIYDIKYLTRSGKSKLGSISPSMVMQNEDREKVQGYFQFSPFLLGT